MSKCIYHNLFKVYKNLSSHISDKCSPNCVLFVNNSVYGKTMEDPERKVDIKLVSTWEAPNSTKTYRTKHEFH